MIALLAACTQGSGCAAGTGVRDDEQPSKDQAPSEPAVPVAQDRSYSAPVMVDKPIPPKPVRDGTPPIVYLLPSDGALRVVNKTTGQEIAAAAAQSRSILRIDDMTGVTLGQQTLVKGPLPPGHEYEIYQSTGAENTVRHGVSSPGR
ncbi:MAG TPA: hypothetical protein VGR35_15710 [Tepidisphaeraceae bacterium]|nr:hypothetical protein [Tepidisphaeraceae bacterium]